MKYLQLTWLSLLLSIYTTHATHITNSIPTALQERIRQMATEWVHSCTPLSASSKELLANLLYLSYRHAYLDEQARKALITLKETLPVLRKNLATLDNPIATNRHYLQATKRFFAFNGLRYHIYLAWQQCTNAIEASNDAVLHEVIEEFQKNGQSIITHYITHEIIPSISVLQLQNHLKENINKLYGITYALDVLFEKENTPPPATDSFFTLNRLCNVSEQIQNVHDTIYTHLAVIEHHKANLLFISKHFFYESYLVLYPHLMNGNQRILFGPMGMLAEENQLQLPLK